MIETKCGYVAIIGRPNVGKSTLLNQLVGEKISISSPKPQTTRWQILGINTVVANEDPTAQIIYIDTPGMHRNEKRAMNRYLNRVAEAGMLDADVVLFMIDATAWHAEDELIIQKLKNIEKPVVLVINKIDLLADKNLLLPFIDQVKHHFDFKHIVPISALKEDSIQLLQNEIITLLPHNPLFFPEDQLTDKSVLFQIGEVVREKIIAETNEEMPYTTTVEIEEVKEEEKIMEINAIIWVERQGQKIIIIGKKGTKLKKIGMRARREIEKIVEKKVFLRLWVKVKENWTDDERALQGLGYHRQ